jgi:hypothetical protein
MTITLNSRADFTLAAAELAAWLRGWVYGGEGAHIWAHS